MIVPSTQEGIAALGAAFGIEAAKIVVEIYKRRKKHKKDSKSKFV